MARALVNGLRARRVDVTTVFEEGRSEQTDAAQLEYAAQQGRVFYSFNVRHFFQLHKEYMAQGKNHAGIILVYRQRYTFGEQIKRLLRLLNNRSVDEMRNSLHFL